MSQILALWKNNYYEGSSAAVHIIRPMPVISPASCPFIQKAGPVEVIFREDSFDPVTRIRRGRLYMGGRGAHRWDLVWVDDKRQWNWANFQPDASYDTWTPGVGPEMVTGQIVELGTGGFATKWRIIDVERISIGHILFTLRAHSFFGVIPALRTTITDREGTPVSDESVQAALAALVDAFHRQLPTPTADVARETARVILATWVGETAKSDDLGEVIKKIPPDRAVVVNAARIISRFHPRGKSAELERQASRGKDLRPISFDDAEASVRLVGLILREIGWAAL